MREFGEHHNRSGYAIRKYLEKKLKKNVPGIRIEYYLWNQVNRIIVENMTRILFKHAEEKANGENSDIFSGSMAVKHKENNFSDILCSFFKWLLSGDRELKEELDMKVKVQSKTISSTITYNMNSKRQAKYLQNVLGQKFNHHRYTPLHQISMGSPLRHFDCNNVILDMLSAPDHGLAIPPLQCLEYETTIANAVINNMKEKDGIYISTNLQKVLPMFHIDNRD